MNRIFWTLCIVCIILATVTVLGWMNLKHTDDVVTNRAPNADHLVMPISTKIDVVIPSNGQGNILPDRCGIDTLDDRIHGGDDLSIDNHPWMALLDYEYVINGKSLTDYQCGGTIINSRYVLTAAHCLYKRNDTGTLVAVRLGEHNLLNVTDCEIIDEVRECAPKPVDYSIESILIHPSYNAKTKENDIGIIRLAKDIVFSRYVSPICISKKNDQTLSINQTLFAVGWGLTEHNAASAVKRIVKLRLWDRNKCASKFKTVDTPIDTKHICAGGELGKDACQNDSGGPLMVLRAKWFLEGVISFGYMCGLQGWPGVYANVRFYYDWIVTNLKP